MFKTLS
ncbi:hypothetical protein YPPY66_3163, partial [Yersinia pestis PY-66]